MNTWSSNQDIYEMAYALGTHRPEVAREVQRADQNPRLRDFVRRRLQLLCHREKIDMANVWNPDPQREQLGDSGLILGHTRHGWLYWMPDEWHYSGLFSGAPGFGKTTLVCNVLIQLAAQGYGAVVLDLRGDYEFLPLVIPNAVLIPWEKNRDNLLAPLDGNTPLTAFSAWWATHFVERFSLQDASNSFLAQQLIALCRDFHGQGRYPDLFDLQTRLERMHIVSKDVRGYRDRTLDRIRLIISECGDELLSVQRGYDLGRMLGEGRIVIYRLTCGKNVADFYTGLTIFRIFLSRLYSEQRFNQRPVFVVLDEQRSMLRDRSQFADRIFEIDRGVTQARALRLCFLIAEQCVTELSHAIKVSTRLKCSFNTQGTQLRATSEMMGMEHAQRDALRELAPGEAVATIGGVRIATPTFIRVPKLHEIQELIAKQP